VAIDGQELPDAGHATQLDAATVVETRSRADDQVPDGTGNKDLSGFGLAKDSRRDVYRDPPDIGVQQFTLAGVDPSADLDSQCLGVIAQRLGAPNGLRRAIERHEVAVAGALQHGAAASSCDVGCHLAEPLE
jgi:hypothetical protein